MVKNLPIMPIIKSEFNSWVGRIPWRKKWQLAAVLLPGKSHGQRNLAEYSAWDRNRVGHNLAAKPPLPHTAVGGDEEIGRPCKKRRESWSSSRPPSLGLSIWVLAPALRLTLCVTSLSPPMASSIK